MDRDRIETWCQKGMLAVVVVAMWFAAIAFGGVDLWARVVLQWLMVLGLVFFSVRLAVARKPRLVMPPAFWAATLFMVYAAGRYWYADVEYVARQELIRVAICYLVFSFVVTTLHGQRSVRFLIYALIALATLESVYAIYQWAANPGTVLGYGQAAQYLTRGSGTLFNPKSGRPSWVGASGLNRLGIDQPGTALGPDIGGLLRGSAGDRSCCDLVACRNGGLGSVGPHGRGIRAVALPAPVADPRRCRSRGGVAAAARGDPRFGETAFP